MGECGSVVKEGGSCVGGAGVDGSDGAMGSGTVVLDDGEVEVEMLLVGGIGSVGSLVSCTTTALSVVSVVFFGGGAAAAGAGAGLGGDT